MRLNFGKNLQMGSSRILFTLTALILALLICKPIFAEELLKPAELTGVIAADKPTGSGTLHKYFMTVYQAQLWRDSKGAVWNGPFALCLTYAIAVTNAQFAETSVKIMREQNFLPDEALDKADKILAQTLPTVAVGDRICALYKPSQPLTFFYNSKAYGHIADANLARAFLNIWLSPKTPEPDLRAALLSEG